MNKNTNYNKTLTLTFFLFILVTITFPPQSFFELVNMLIFLICIFLGVIDKNIFGPFILFSITALSIVLYDINYSDSFLLPLSEMTEKIIIYGNLSFMLGLIISKFALPFKKQHKNEILIDKKEIYLVLFIGLLPFLIGTLISLPLILSGQILEAKENYALPIIGLFSLFKYLALVMAFSYGNKKLIINVGLLVAISIFFNITKFEIGLLITSLIMPLFKYKYIKLNRRGILKLLPLIILISALFLFIFDYYNSIRTAASMGENFDLLNYYYENGRIDNDVPRFLALPLMYLLTPWTNLHYVIESLPSFTNGLWVFKPILSFLQLDLLFGISYEDRLLPYKSSFNTFTYLAVLYSDFGVLGIILIPFLLGIYIYYLYKVYLRSSNPFNVTIYIFNAYAVILMFFSNHFFMLSYPFIIIILIFLYRLIRSTLIRKS